MIEVKEPTLEQMVELIYDCLENETPEEERIINLTMYFPSLENKNKWLKELSAMIQKQLNESIND